MEINTVAIHEITLFIYKKKVGSSNKLMYKYKAHRRPHFHSTGINRQYAGRLSNVHGSFNIFTIWDTSCLFPQP